MLKESIRKPDTVFESAPKLTLVNLNTCVLILTLLPYIAYALSRSLSIVTIIFEKAASPVIRTDCFRDRGMAEVSNRMPFLI